jgi:competence protein ComEC
MKWFVLLVILTFSYRTLPYEEKNYFEITVLDIGQGDSILFKTHDNKNILIDTGKDDSIVEKLDEELFPRKIIDILIITHYYTDHFGRLIEILKYYELKTLILPPDYKSNKTTSDLKAELNKRNIRLLVPTAGAEIRLDKFSTIEFTWPLTLEQYFTLPSNDSSISFVINIGEFNAFFAGDLSSMYEEEIKEEIGNIDLLKVSHHGSKTSTSDEFLNHVLPEVSLISAGRDNAYGHPAKEIVENIREVDSEILQTNLDGDITIQVYPDTYHIFTEREGLKYQNRIENNRI